MAEPPIKNVQDTAFWMAVFRARETERPDALFRDPYAGILAGERGERIVREMGSQDRNEWSYVARTLLFDELVRGAVESGVDLVVNLAAGLDVRPYRMNLPSSLEWVEVDRADVVAHKEEVLAGETPQCAVERVALDLADVDGRRALFRRVGSGARGTGGARRAFVFCEGLLIYLAEADVGALARDLAAEPAFGHWGVDLVSPALAKMIRRQIGDALERAGSPFQFTPASGPDFFLEHGWRLESVESILKEGARLGRLSLFLRLLALLPDSAGRRPSRPWSGVLLLERTT